MKVIGIGNALVDLLTAIENDQILNDLNLPKGSMQLVDGGRMNDSLEATKHLKRTLASGGSAANTIHGLSRLGIETGFIGKIGPDELGKAFSADMIDAGIKPILYSSQNATGTALALISKDSERTFAVHLGAAIELGANDISLGTYNGFQMLHIEGYLVQNHSLIETAVKLAKEAGLTISLDLASYNVVESNREFLKRIISHYVDIVFANEEEAKAFTGKSPEESLSILASITKIAVVKIGSKGSLIQSGKDVYKVGIITSKPIDTTGAGDLYASGFLYGLSNKLPLNVCGEIGALLAGRVIEVMGPKLNESAWKDIKTIIDNALKNKTPITNSIC